MFSYSYMRQTLPLWLALAATTGTIGLAPATRALGSHWSLPKIVQYADQHAPDLASGRREIEIAKRAAELAGYERLPKISGYVTGSVGSSSEESKKPLVNSVVGLELSELIYDGGKIDHAMTQARIKYQLTQLQFKKARDQKIFSVAKVFFQLSLLQALDSMLSKSHQQLEKQHEAVRLAYRAGVKKQNDYLRVKVDADTSQAGLEANHIEIVKTVNMLKDMIGFPVDKDLVCQHVEIENLFYSKVIPKITAANHIDLQIAQLEKASAELDKNFSFRSVYPDVRVEAQVRYQNLQSGDALNERKNNTQSQLQVTVSYPLWDWGARQNERTDAAQRNYIAANSFSSTRSRIQTEIANLQIDLQHLHRRLELTRAIVGQSEKSFAVIAESYRQGRSAYLDFITAHREVQQAKESFLRSKLEIVQQELSLYAMQGTLYETLVH